MILGNLSNIPYFISFEEERNEEKLIESRELKRFQEEWGL